jgi:hypothetical protein
MLKLGRLQEIAKQILHTTLQIVAVQEISWKGYGHIKKKDCSMYYSCNLEETGQLGTGFIVKRKMKKSIRI